MIMFTKKLRLSACLMTAFSLAMIQGCAQGREGIGAGASQDEIWASMQLCSNDVSGNLLLACVSVQPDITADTALITVEQLGFNPGQVPYRLLARPAGNAVYDLLQDSITTTAGGTFTVTAHQPTHIEQYDSWRIELTVNYDGNQQEAADAGQGYVAAEAILNWPELTQSNSTQATN